jgi:hypothetical protein
MSEKPISSLRQRVVEDMTVRNFIEKTRNDYIRHVLSFTAFLCGWPDIATPEDLRHFQLHQTQIGVRPPSINALVAVARARELLAVTALALRPPHQFRSISSERFPV